MVAIVQSPRGVETLVSGDFNTDMAAPDRHKHNKTTKLTMVTEGLEDIADHFLPCHQPWTRDGRT